MPSVAERIKLAPPQALLGLGVVLAGVLYLVQGTGPDISLQLNDVKAKLSKAEAKLTETKEATQNKAKFQEEMERVSQTFRLALEYLPKELDIQDLLKKVYSEARAAGVELTTFKPKESVSKDFYDEIPMEFGISGNYFQLVTFLANIGKLPRIINVLNVEITSTNFVDGMPMLKLTGILVGYRYKEAVTK